jgi:hypothetical protein
VGRAGGGFAGGGGRAWIGAIAGDTSWSSIWRLTYHARPSVGEGSGPDLGDNSIVGRLWWESVVGCSRATRIKWARFVELPQRRIHRVDDIRKLDN